PTRKAFSEHVNAIIAPGEAGYFGVLPGHTPFLTSLKIGDVKIEIGDKTKHYAISGGFAEVYPGGVRILAETAEQASEIDTERAKQAKERAERRIHQGRKESDVDRAQLALTRAMNRLKIAQFLKA
ncbi:F0F1 ATP synthase subunit epsilon, partial [candidate division KSB1 bacterium]|nr:F0F1 ATP synthase subunit epsilon [candidate division KSB1 bacterium]